MNAEQWLERATKGMPEAVCARVAAETLAHLEDAGVGEGADVRPLLGNPKVLRRELGRLYLPNRRLQVLLQEDLSEFEKLRSLLFSYAWQVVWFCFTLSLLHSKANLPQAELLIQAAWLIQGVWVVSLFLTGRLRSERRKLWHDTLGLFNFYMQTCLYTLSNFLKNHDGSFWSNASVIVMPFMFCYFLWSALREDQRLRRTLALISRLGAAR